MQTEINIPWAHSPAPKEPGIHVIADQNLEELVPFIDWFYLFYAWRIPGKFPEILEGDSPKAETARKLYADAQKRVNYMLETHMTLVILRRIFIVNTKTSTKLISITFTK